MKRSTLSFICSVVIATSAALSPAYAATTAPDVMIRQVVEQTLTDLRSNKEQIEEQGVFDFVNKRLLPHFDFDYMSQLVVGRHWRTASVKQRADFSDQFKTLLIKTYAGALESYTDEVVEILPYRAGADPEDALVSTEIAPKAGPAIPIDYSLHLKEGQWIVYDVSIDGLSLVTNYRRSFGRKIKSEGINELIADLKSKNNS
ncbi:MAG: phospholipid transport system substrate-binding protein [Gammaproteobacteria bacterium]|jgi:phospholipid transport system substrate-binding protein